MKLGKLTKLVLCGLQMLVLAIGVNAAEKSYIDIDQTSMNIERLKDDLDSNTLKGEVTFQNGFSGVLTLEFRDAWYDRYNPFRKNTYWKLEVEGKETKRGKLAMNINAETGMVAFNFYAVAHDAKITEKTTPIMIVDVPVNSMYSQYESNVFLTAKYGDEGVRIRTVEDYCFENVNGLFLTLDNKGMLSQLSGYVWKHKSDIIAAGKTIVTIVALTAMILG